MTSVRRRLAVLGSVCVAVAIVSAGCASIPANTLPERVSALQGDQNGQAAVAQPQKNDTPGNIVRGFVDSSGDPTDLHAAARVYLTAAAQNSWNRSASTPSVSIIGDIFNTNPMDSGDPGTAIVELSTELLGTVNPEGSFQPADPADAADYRVTLHLHQTKGQWRIVDPPGSLLMTKADFDRYYRPVSIYFFDQSWDVLVPDQRYVLAEPASGVVARIVQLLLDGPSDSLKDAVQDAIPGDASLKTNVVEQENGEITINLKSMADQASNTKQLMIAQLVYSLQDYGSSVAVQSEAQPLVPGHIDWRPGDLPLYTPSSGVKTTGGLVVTHGRIINLSDGVPLKGPAGDGTYDVLTAAESADGTELATVTTAPGGGEVLRIGGLTDPAAPVNGLTATQFTRPTWTPSDSAGDASRSVWTVADGVVLRVVNTPQGGWAASPVDATDLAQYGPITDLRLSRDGTRVAVVADGKLLVGAVVDDQGTVAIRQVQQLQPTLTDVTGVDWVRQDQLVVADQQAGTAPIQTVSVDGLKVGAYTSANLASAVTAVAAWNGQPVLAVDMAGLWESTDPSEAWQQAEHFQPAGAIPFYPG